MDENEVVDPATEVLKRRFVLFSNGYTMSCFNLKQQTGIKYESIDAVPLLPKPTTSLKFLSTSKESKERYPVMAGLFKLGCTEAYMIGGLRHSGYTDPSTVNYNDYFEWGYHLYSLILASKHATNASSSLHPYLLSKAADDSTLFLSSECEIPPLNKPKIWPIVEKIGGHLHVFDSIPRWYAEYVVLHDRVEFSHEVLNLHDRKEGWTEIQTSDLRIGGYRYYNDHLVVGDHIYLIGFDCFYIFDSSVMKWKICPKLRFPTFNGFRYPLKQVWHIMKYGGGRCLGEFLHHGERNKQLYMVLAIVADNCGYDDSYKVVAVAYLASSTGQVLCFQPLTQFFEGEPGILKLCTLFNVNELEMCSVVTAGMMFGKYFVGDILMVNVFVAEAVSDVGAKVRDMCEEADRITDYEPVELEFVQVVVKERYVYKMGIRLKERGVLHTFSNVQACCL